MKIKEAVVKIDKILSDEKAFRKVLDDTFRLMDKDGNGQIDSNEVKAFVDFMISELKVPMDPDPSLITDFIMTFDTDHNGTISKAELYPALKQLIIEWRKYLVDDE